MQTISKHYKSIQTTLTLIKIKTTNVNSRNQHKYLNNKTTKINNIQKQQKQQNTLKTLINNKHKHESIIQPTKNNNK